MDSTLAIVTFVVALAATAFLSSIEAALAGITAGRARTAMIEKLPRAQRLRAWLDGSSRMLASLNLLGLCFAVTAAVAAWTFVAERHPAMPVAGALAAIAVVVFVVGHLIPRVLGKAQALRWSIATVGVARVVTILLVPLTWPLGWIVRGVAALGGAPSSWSSAYSTPDDLERVAVEIETGALGQRGTELFHSIIEFSDTVIREIMVPRTEMVVLEVSSSAEAVLRTVVEARHSRVPVYEETIDRIVGVLHVKDLFHALAYPDLARDPRFDLRRAVRPAFYVPEVMKISELLREFQRRKTHMAIVVDEYGGTAGVVTLEDIIEEIVGEIQDEYDIDEKQFRVLGDNKIIADGRVNIWDLERALAVEFPDDADYETLAGFLVSRAGYLPRPGTVIHWDSLRFTVKEADEKRVGTVEIERRREAPRAG